MKYIKKSESLLKEIDLILDSISTSLGVKKTIEYSYDDMFKKKKSLKIEINNETITLDDNSYRFFMIYSKMIEELSDCYEHIDNNANIIGDNVNLELDIIKKIRYKCFLI